MTQDSPTSPFRVAVRRCSSYDDCDGVLSQLLTDTGLSDVLRNSRVLLKPNMMKATAADRADATHPSIVASLTRVLMAMGCEVWVGDSSGLLGLTAEVLEGSGMAPAVRAVGGKTINLDAGPFEKISSTGSATHEIWVPRILFDVQHVVQVPKLKTHSLTGMSCSIKNLMGLLPGATKCALHVRRPSALPLSHALLDLAETLVRKGVHLSGTVVDAVWAQERKGASEGPRRRDLGLIIASRDLFATDLVCSQLIDADRHSLSTVLAAFQRRLGPCHLEDVEIVGDRNAIHAAVPLEKYWPVHTGHYWFRERIVRPWHDPRRCHGTRACIDVCPTDAMRIVGKRIEITSQCIRCFACRAACPHGAIKLEVPFGMRAIFSRRAEGIDLSKVLR